jgi:anti-sigma factor RsiW
MDPPDCPSPEMRRLLVPYALGSCTDDAEQRFEAHVLTCERCFEDLKSVDRTRLLIQEFVGEDRPDTRAAREIVRRRRLLRTLACLGGGLLLLALGFLLGRLV